MPPESRQHVAQIHPAGGNGWRQGDSAPERCRGGLKVSLLAKGEAEDAIEQCTVGVNLQRRPAVIDGVFESLQPTERFAA